MQLSGGCSANDIMKRRSRQQPDVSRIIILYAHVFCKTNKFAVYSQTVQFHAATLPLYNLSHNVITTYYGHFDLSC